MSDIETVVNLRSKLYAERAKTEHLTNKIDSLWCLVILVSGLALTFLMAWADVRFGWEWMK